VEQKPKTVRQQAEDLLSLLVADWRPTVQQVLWAVRIAVVLSLIVAIGYFYDITIWDWIKLLIIPAAIAAAGVWFNQ
jgi:type III secretory pathway component EscS